MSAYVISEVEMRDAAGFEAYRTIAAKRLRNMVAATWSATQLKKRRTVRRFFNLARSCAGSDCGRLRRSRYLHHQ
jgi:hypothetical protein